MFADRQRWVIGGGVVMIAVLAWWGLRPASPAAAPATVQDRPRAARQAAGAEEPLRPIRLEQLALSANREEAGDTERNPFLFQTRAAVRGTPVAPVPVDRGEGPRTPMPMPVSGPPPMPPIPLKLIGLVERANGVKWAVLSDGRVTMHGRDGDIIDGRYKIVKIGTESIELTYIDGRGRQTVRLTGL